MNNKVTLPPISDIFSGKDVSLGPFPTHPRPNPPYTTMPVYPYNYVPPNAGVMATYGTAPSSYNYYGSGAYTAMPPALEMPASVSRSVHGSTSGPSATERTRSGSEQLSVSPVTSPTLEGGVSSASANIQHHSRSRTRNNLPKETTYILLKWLNDHLNHPYPNSFEKTRLMMATGLNQQQLSNWFINARRRKIKVLRQKKLASE